MADSSIRINKYLRNAGCCSRREADKLIESGKVEINDQICGLGDRVSVNDRVKVNGKPVFQKKDKTYIALNKPLGVVCTSEKREPDNIIDYLGFDGYITYAGRLDKDSTGLLLMTDDGELIDSLMRSVHEHEKEYICTIDKKVTPAFIKKMSNGVQILDTVTKKCKVSPISDREFSIILTQGLNRQIRRMCEACGCKVISLKRIRIKSLLLGDLLPGEFRFLTDREIRDLKK